MKKNILLYILTLGLLFLLLSCNIAAFLIIIVLVICWLAITGKCQSHTLRLLLADNLAIYQQFLKNIAKLYINSNTKQNRCSILLFHF